MACVVVTSIGCCTAAPLPNSTGSLSATRSAALAHRSAGALRLLDRNGDLVQAPAVARVPIRHAPPAAPSTPATALDPRIGSNLRLGDDPAQLPPTMRAQAEPHIARSPNNPDLLAATFQEGRYTDGGAVDCGYAISHDGGLTWTRALIPALTQLTGGVYQRATDPVAGIDSQGNIYLNTLGIAGAVFAVAVSRSTNGGVSFEAPVEVYRAPTRSLQPDKNWMTINTFSQTPTSGRVVVTWTMFTADPYPLACSFSDDAGQTWSPVSYATPTHYYCQGSQPVFLPDGTLAIVYWNFDSNFTPGETIEIVTSADGGATFGAPRLVTPVTSYSVPWMRTGTFLPSATVDRSNGVIHVTYQALAQGVPRIMFTKSANQGATWTTPKPVSDNPATAPVFNPAIAASPDGQTLTIVFYDERINPGQTYFVDTYLAQSFDGGTTWQPNLRVTTDSSDVRLAPLTVSGYMLGDYLGIAPPTTPDVPAVPIWVDTRTGSPDPFIARVGCTPQVTFASWRAARFSMSQIADPLVGEPNADPNDDGVGNLHAYAFGLNPWLPERPVFNPTFSGNGSAATFAVTWERLAAAADLGYVWQASTDFTSWSTAVPSRVVITANPTRQTETVTSTFPADPDGKRCYRLGVTLAP
ncbi:MAG: sialidase family protein [Verrucomicrobia bacterium]|nr:sialidase family protein [Verrucomicrobiota bacterium]